MQPTDNIPAENEKQPVPRKPSFDGKRYLEQTLHRKAGEIIKVVRIPHTDSYRVNWYNPSQNMTAAIPGPSIMYIRESKFLFCRLDAEGKPQITYPARQ